MCQAGTKQVDTNGDGCEDACEPIACPPVVPTCPAGQKPADTDGDGCVDLERFERLYVDEEPIEEVAASMKMTREAIYAWRNRVGKLLRRFASELDDVPPLNGGARERTSMGTPRDG